MNHHTVGIDVSKDMLDAHRLPDGAHRRFANNAGGHRQLIAWIGADVARVVYEPTGAYHRAMERALDAVGLPLVKVNPRQARRFAEAIGCLAKTDRIDAAMLARMGLALTLDPHPAPSTTIADLRELMVARRALVRDRTACLNRAKQLTLALTKRHCAARLRQIERQIAAVDTALQEAVAADPDLARRHAILVSIPGIGDGAALALLIDMPELGALGAKQAASLAGLAPRTRQSGTRTLRAHLCGGRKTLRDALFMPALVATRYNPNMKRKYDDLLAAGKPKKLAVAAIMRKLLLLANALLKANRTWEKRTA
jgi:transposase